MARITTTEVATALNVLPEAVRFTCNATRIPIAPDNSFEYPEGAQRKHWHSVLACQPLTVAERLRSDLGLRPPRKVPE